jgi:hypothetical protein
MTALPSSENNCYFCGGCSRCQCLETPPAASRQTLSASFLENAPVNKKNNIERVNAETSKLYMERIIISTVKL